MDPNTPNNVTKFYIGDVGAASWEEVNEGGHHKSGVNYGYPIREGPCVRHSVTDCLLHPGHEKFENPTFWYPHDEVHGGAVVGLVVPPKGVWPPEYDDTFMYTDYVTNQTFLVHRDNSFGCNNCIPPEPNWKTSKFHAIERPVTFKFGPYLQNNGLAVREGGALYFAARSSRLSVGRIVYRGGNNTAPEARISKNGGNAAVGDVVTFDASKSNDADGDELYFDWDFGDGRILTNGPAVVQHQFTQSRRYTVTLVVRDGTHSSFETISFNIGKPPVAIILQPEEGTKFAVGERLTLQGAGVDGEGKPLDPSNLVWQAVIHHNTHEHDFMQPESGESMTLDPAPSPEDLFASTTSYLEVRLTVSTEDGLTTTVTRAVMPKTIELEFDTIPSGLELSLDNVVLRTPQKIVSWDNHLMNVVAPDQGKYKFQSWSNGQSFMHNIRVLANTTGSETKLVAAFKEKGSPSLLTCSDYDGLVKWKQMCSHKNACCGTIRSDSSYCWNIYDNVFPGD